MTSNSTTKTPYYDLDETAGTNIEEEGITPKDREKGLGVPLWVIIVWTAVAVLIITMIVLIFYVCHTRKSAPPQDRTSEDEERRRSIATFDNYPQGYIDELHTKQPIAKQLFESAFVDDMRIPRAVEVRMTDTSMNSRDYMPQQNNATEATRSVSFEELGFHGYEYGHYDDDDDDFNELHPNRRISLSRDASFKASNISEENKAKQIYRERMLVNELREKIRRDKRNEDDHKW